MSPFTLRPVEQLNLTALVSRKIQPGQTGGGTRLVAILYSCIVVEVNRLVQSSLMDRSPTGVEVGVGEVPDDWPAGVVNTVPALQDTDTV